MTSETIYKGTPVLRKGSTLPTYWCDDPLAVPEWIIERVGETRYVVDLPYIPGDKVYVVIGPMPHVQEMVIESIQVTSKGHLVYDLITNNGTHYAMRQGEFYRTEDEADNVVAAIEGNVDELKEWWSAYESHR